MHYPLPLATRIAGYSHRFVAIPDASRTREAELAWGDRAEGSAKCITAFLSRRCRRLAAPGRY